jgi:ribose 5-phosphate isomerase RpiB
MKVGIAADHGGYEMKQQIAALLGTEGHEVVDFGNDRYDSNDDRDCVKSFLAAKFSKAERHRRRLAKVNALCNNLIVAVGFPATPLETESHANPKPRNQEIGDSNDVI